MLVFRLIHTIIILIAITHLYCHRRISKGKKLEKFKRYLVYFVHSDLSTTTYDGWTCAGALVHSLFVVTAAACLEDVQNLYAMAGYAKLVPYERIDLDQCTTKENTRKKKVISTCVPKSYELDYANVEKWSLIDIGVAKVDSPFMKHDDYMQFCSIKPLRVPINFNPAYQAPSIDALVMGWGHLEIWRKPGDTANYIQEFARYASVRIIDKKRCKEYYKDFPDLQNTIDKYMICTMGKGHIDSAGVVDRSSPHFKEECTGEGQGCRRDFQEGSHWHLSSPNRTYNINGRRQGFCQNDHGAPLVTWIGGTEHLIGVASVFRVDEKGKCAGPYLFTSTHCNGVFLNCVLEDHLYKNNVNNSNGDHRRRSAVCNLPARERGFEMIHKHIKWFNYTNMKRKSGKHRRQKLERVTKHTIKRTTNKDILNEKIGIRPQISIRDFYRNQSGIETKNIHI